MGLMHSILQCQQYNTVVKAVPQLFLRVVQWHYYFF